MSVDGGISRIHGNGSSAPATGPPGSNAIVLEAALGSALSTRTRKRTPTHDLESSARIAPPGNPHRARTGRRDGFVLRSMFKAARLFPRPSAPTSPVDPESRVSPRDGSRRVLVPFRDGKPRLPGALARCGCRRFRPIRLETTRADSRLEVEDERLRARRVRRRAVPVLPLRGEHRSFSRRAFFVDLSLGKVRSSSTPEAGSRVRPLGPLGSGRRGTASGQEAS
jgi:hypothetical protein